MFLKLLNRNTIVPFAASTIGADPRALQALIDAAGRDLAPVAGPDFSPVSAALSLVRGDLSPLRTLYDQVLSVRELRPGIAKVAAEWLKMNDTQGIALSAMSFVAKLPVLHMDQEFDSVESFLLEGLLPLLDEVFSSPPNCPICDGEFYDLNDELLCCSDCGHYKDK